MRTTHWMLAGAAAAALALVAGCAALEPTPDYDTLVAQMMKSSFRDQGIAKVDRLTQDAANAECSKALGEPLPNPSGKAIENANHATIRKPSDGKYLGDWQAGEKIAQDGRGQTWTDRSAAAGSGGGNCYNCHQIGKAEISFGTLGPSLYHYGRIRGVTGPNSADALPVVEYTWGKLYNAKAFNACSLMPRFGNGHLLTEQQMKDLMALLLDPKSPVNQ